jgi:hypothetical protein
MRKSQIAVLLQEEALSKHENWLNTDQCASIAVTSEQSGYPIEAALASQEPGWRAATAGSQIIRLIFDNPQTLRRIQLIFEDRENTRTQEFVLRWSLGAEHSFREIVRQQWNFSPHGSVRETEDYKVQLSEVALLELIVVPDKSGGDAQASLRSFRIA